MQKEKNIQLLFVILVVFCVSVGFLHGRKILSLVAHAESEKGDVNKLTASQAYQYIQTVLVSRNMPLLVQIISRLSSKEVPQIIKKILDDDLSPLNKEEKIEVSLGVAQHVQNRSVAYEIFDMFLAHGQVLRTPLLVVAARSVHHEIIPVILRWMQDRSKSRIVKGMIDSALSYVINTNDLSSLDVLFSKQLRINQKKASKLLWDVVANKKDISFIPFLIRQAHADVNVSVDGKRTPMIVAVEQDRMEMVRVLLEEGADPSKMISAEVGTPLQVAIGHDLTAIETLLREFGAKR